MAASFEETLAVFSRIADRIEASQEAVASILTQVETYKMARLEVSKSIRALRTFYKELPYLSGRRPIGKVGIVLPFNTPLYSLVLYAFGPALSGNRVFVKPSSISYEVTEAIWSIAVGADVELPVSLHAPGKWFLQELCLRDEEVDAISFTGQWSSFEAMHPLVPTGVRLIYSGSGYNPFIVLSNADIPAAAESAVFSRLWNSGQDCLASERFYIEASIFDKFVDCLRYRLKQIVCGANEDKRVDVGLLCSDGLVQNAQNLIEQSGNNSRALLTGTINGRLITPFVFEAEYESPLVVTEKYAPLFALVRVDNRQQLPVYANSLDFALAATVWGEDPALIASLEASHIAHNTSILTIEDEDAHVPFGGYKNSGMVRYADSSRVSSGPILYSVETSLPE